VSNFKKLLTLLPLCLSLCQCGVFSGSKGPDKTSGTQADWVAQKVQRGFSSPDLVAVDKVAATATGYRNNKKVFSFPVLLSQRRGDVLNESVSAFSQKVTPATYFKDAIIRHDPRYPSMYKERAVITYAESKKFNGKREVLSIHSTLTSGDEANIADGRASNNRLSNGCIRVSHSDYKTLLDFMMPGGGLAALKKAQEKKELTEFRSKVHVVVVPEYKRDYKGTLSTLRL